MGNGSLMEVETIAECATFWCSFEWLLKTGFTVKPVLSGHLKIEKSKVLMGNGSLIEVDSIAECSTWSILQYFWPPLRGDRYWKSIFGVVLSGRFRQVLLYFKI